MTDTRNPVNRNLKEKDYWIAFSAFPQIGPARFTLLRKYFGSAKKAWEAPIGEYLKIGFKNSFVETFENFRRELDVDLYLLRLDKLNVQVLTLDDKNYPERLKKIDDSPYTIYVKNQEKSTTGITGSTHSTSSGLASTTGLRDFAEVAVAVIGTRKMTSYGKEATERLVTGLVKSGVVVVSGLALGIDSVAHQTAIESGGRTIAVLGNGLDSIYPPRNKQLGEMLIKSGRGILVSEYPLGYPAMPQNFPNRNRIISGLSLGVLVIEGARKSGTLLTASSAALQGREVFAVPGPITSPMSQAPNFLLKNGAKLVEKAEDILEELDINVRRKTQYAKRILPETEDEKKIMELLENEGLDIDNLVRISSMQTGQVLGTLTNMELKGMVKSIGGKYELNNS